MRQTSETSLQKPIQLNSAYFDSERRQRSLEDLNKAKIIPIKELHKLEVQHIMP